MTVSVNYALADGRMISQEEIGVHLAAIAEEPTIIVSMDRQIAVFLIDNNWVAARATQMLAGNIRIRRTGKGLTPEGQRFLESIQKN